MSMPSRAKILTVQLQYDRPFIWALVNTDNNSLDRIISIYGTGHDISGLEGNYIGTFQQGAGTLVWHGFSD